MIRSYRFVKVVNTLPLIAKALLGLFCILNCIQLWPDTVWHWFLREHNWIVTVCACCASVRWFCSDHSL